jgi:myo-inositol-1(or 4)-monophosphatase
MEECKKYVVELAKKAGSFLLQGFKSTNPIRNQSKDPKYLVTKFDLESEKIIIGGIKKKYPRHNILSEEAGLIDNRSPYTWIVDPLDGTGNFTKKNPFFSISIALRYQKELILGVVYAPALDELYIAEKGKGAFLNNTPISVSSTQGLKKSSVVSCEGSDKKIIRSVRLFQIIRPFVLDMRKLGSAAIESAWVACGRADAYIVTKINPWDIAAGVILVEEAGGRVTDFKGRKWNLKKSDLILSNGKIHEQLLAKTKEGLERATV